MQSDYDDEDIVTIIPGRVEHPEAIYALKSPTFCLRKDGIIYATIGAWEYDASKAKTPEQKRDVAQLDSDFDTIIEDPEKYIREAIIRSEEVMVSYQQTGPEEGGG
ncbi:hypothetical protein SAMN02745824_2319 [Parasphingorhabdus marina DSM 22363]|uniref:Uncharacterized protein n=1 Tax=Parasphingorhabdus marina DSM 22363 TaxID=1123272 RepID=A0A1N6FB41_9SPHN|nr:hypothetical protein [Parasphingorhabdus marina]SIN92493.1 hypothetical protein SAMN02745824_2319 [Parasphingorhabdus marina DSM 22363]